MIHLPFLLDEGSKIIRVNSTQPAKPDCWQFAADDVAVNRSLCDAERLSDLPECEQAKKNQIVHDGYSVRWIGGHAAHLTESKLSVNNSITPTAVQIVQFLRIHRKKKNRESSDGMSQKKTWRRNADWS